MSKPDSTINDVLEVISDLSEAMAVGFDNLRTELKGDITDLRTEMKDDIHGLQKDMSELIQDVSILKKDVRDLKVDMAEVKAIATGHEENIREIYRILTRIEAGLKISEADRLATKERLERIIAWAQEASRQLDIPLKVD